MPYAIRKKGKKFLVVKKEGGKILGTHDSRSSAERQIRAIYANEKKK